MLRRSATGLLVVAVTVGMLGAAIRSVAGRPGTGTAGPLLAEVFTRPDGLITNEHASWSPSDPAAVVSGTWRVTSGSLFADGNNAWTGVPDDRQPDAGSAHGTGSAVFRLVTRRTDLGDVQVSLRLRNLGLVSTASTPPAAWDGVHLFLRYQSQYQLYYASVNRRDATAAPTTCSAAPSVTSPSRSAPGSGWPHRYARTSTGRSASTSGATACSSGTCGTAAWAAPRSASPARSACGATTTSSGSTTSP